MTLKKPEERWRNGAGYNTQSDFYEAIQHYGWDNITHIILEEGDKTLEEISERETYWTKFYHADDIQHGGFVKRTGGIKGLTSEETKLKQSLCKIGELNPMFGRHLSNKTRQLLSQKNMGRGNPFYGKKHSNEAKLQMSINNNQNKAVICIETGKEFRSCAEAARNVGLKSGGHIAECCENKRKTSGGYSWKWKY